MGLIQGWGSYKGGAHTRVGLIEICNGIAFVFYQRLLHILISRIDVVLPMCPAADAPGNESGPEGELPVHCWAMGGGHCSLGRL